MTLNTIMSAAVYLLVGALVLAAAQAVGGGVTNCAWNEYDLSPLAAAGDVTGTDNLYQYTINVCGVVSEANCHARNGSMCQYDLNAPPAYKHELSDWVDGSGVWAECNDAVNCPKGGVTVSFANGDVCSPQLGARRVAYVIACAPDQTTFSTFQIISSVCNYTVLIQHQSGCGGPPRPPPVNCAGAGFDLTPLYGVDLTSNSALYQWRLSVCGSVATEVDCAAHNGSMCQYAEASPNVYRHVISKWDESASFSACSDPVLCPSGGANVSFANGDECMPGTPRTLNLIVACSDAVSTPRGAYNVTAIGPCAYQAVMSDPVGCPPPPPAPVTNCQYLDYDFSPLANSDLKSFTEPYNYRTCAH